MNNGWRHTFRNRMNDFEIRYKQPPNAISVSIKVRVTSGCFHREHSPHAYKLIDDYLEKIVEQGELSFEEHESGPEILIYIAAATAGLSFTKSIIDLIVIILKARSKGIEKGDNPTAPLELIVRRVQKAGEVQEEVVLRIGYHDIIKREEIEKDLKKSLSVLLSKNEKENS